jgi:hypothetical protein
MFGTVFAAAARRQAPPLVPVVVDFDDGYGLTDHESVRGPRQLVLERLPERPEAFVIPVGIDGDLLDQLLEIR